MIRRTVIVWTFLFAACSEGIDPNLKPEDLWLPPETEQQPVLPDGIKVRVASLNLHGGSEASAERVAEFFGALDLDLIALQEAPEAYARELATRLPLSHVAATEGRAILSKTPLENIEHVELESGRAFTHATSTIAGALFSIYSVHIGWNVEGDLQARELVDEHLALDPHDHLVVAGDFNDEHYSSQNDILEELLADVWTALGLYPGERISWPATAFDGSEGSQLIDLIFYRRSFPAIVVDGDIVNTAPVLSDHKPVWAELLYPRTVRFGEDPYARRRDVFRDFPAQLPPNLLINGNAEDGLAAWSSAGDMIATEQRREHRAYEGSKFFAGSEDDEPRSWLSQTVALARDGGELLVSGYMTTAYTTVESSSVVSNFVRPYDEGEIIVETLDDEGTILSRATSKRRDTLDWDPYAARLSVPRGATRARVTLVSHRKPTSGEGNDAAFDDLYLGHLDTEVGGERNLLYNFGGEQQAIEGWQSDRFRALPSGEQLGLMLFPPQSFSGAQSFFLGGGLGLEGGPASKLVQEIAFGFEEDVVVRFGGWVRTYAATTAVSIALELLDDDKNVWGTLALPKSAAAEWTRIEGRARIPRGVRAVRFIVSGDEQPLGDAVFADELDLFSEARRRLRTQSTPLASQAAQRAAPLEGHSSGG